MNKITQRLEEFDRDIEDLEESEDWKRMDLMQKNKNGFLEGVNLTIDEVLKITEFLRDEANKRFKDKHIDAMRNTWICATLDELKQKIEELKHD